MSGNFFSSVLLLTRLLSVTVGLLSPRNLRVSDEWYTRFRVAWDPVPAPVQGYKLIYSPTGQNMFTIFHKKAWELLFKIK